MLRQVENVPRQPSRWHAIALAMAAVTTIIVACQDYAFETREPRRIQGRQIREIVTTVTPADILFVLDNSGSMIDELAALQNNLDAFIEVLTQSANDYQIGFITPDMECNVPTRDCTGSGTTSNACCNRNLPMCEEELDGDGKIVRSTCDGGRLRALDGVGRIFKRPQPEDLNNWLDSVRATVDDLGCHGSGYEAGLEAARVALLCSVGSDKCPDPAVAQLNAGFIRPEADLVIIFISDEDDCSFMNHNVYSRLTDNGSFDEQATKLCSPNECYAYIGADLDFNENALMDWADRTSSIYQSKRFYCGGITSPPRLTNPPMPDAVDRFVADILEVKGNNASKVRAAAVLGAMADPADATGFRASGCLRTGLGPSDACGCWSTGGPIFCDVTGQQAELHSDSGLLADQLPLGGELPQCQSCVTNADCASSGAVCDTVLGRCSSDSPGGCQAMAGGRYLEFLRGLASERIAVEEPGGVLVDSICQFQYDDTLQEIAETLIFDNCFNIGEVIPEPAADHLQVTYNGTLLRNVPTGSGQQGWSYQTDATEICLEGSLEKNIDDRFELYLIDKDNTAGDAP